MNYHATHPVLSEQTFVTMAIMSCINLVVALFSLTSVVTALVPYFQIAALTMTIYVGWRTINKEKRNRYGKK